MIYNARKGQYIYGQGIGILKLDNDFTPFIPGDVSNASTFNFPVTYEVVKGLTIERATSKDPTALEALIIAGKKLENSGVKAISSSCGYLGFFQCDLARVLRIPVFLSSLLQLPLISAMVGPNRKVGIICAREATFDKSLLEAVGVNPMLPIVVKGLDNFDNFCRSLINMAGYLDPERIEEEIVTLSKKMVEEAPSIGAILLECADLPPYSKAVQQAINLPVFDFVTMINYVFSATVRAKFEGFM